MPVLDQFGNQLPMRSDLLEQKKYLLLSFFGPGSYKNYSIKSIREIYELKPEYYILDDLRIEGYRSIILREPSLKVLAVKLAVLGIDLNAVAFGTSHDDAVAIGKMLRAKQRHI